MEATGNERVCTGGAYRPKLSVGNEEGEGQAIVISREDKVDINALILVLQQVDEFAGMDIIEVSSVVEGTYYVQRRTVSALMGMYQKQTGKRWGDAPIVEGTHRYTQVLRASAARNEVDGQHF